MNSSQPQFPQRNDQSNNEEDHDYWNDRPMKKKFKQTEDNRIEYSSNPHNYNQSYRGKPPYPQSIQRNYNQATKPEQDSWGYKKPENDSWGEPKRIEHDSWGQHQNKQDNRQQSRNYDNDRRYNRPQEHRFNSESSHFRNKSHSQRDSYHQDRRREHKERDNYEDRGWDDHRQPRNRENEISRFDERHRSNHRGGAQNFDHRHPGQYQQKNKPSLLGLFEKTTQLPIHAFKEEIIETINNNQVTIISGDTGCGKSTQIPKYIMEDCISKGIDCKIICTQPRRIAAMSLAKRVQTEIEENHPNVDPRLVGYHIGMESNYGRNSKIIFVTNGIFLQRFIHEDESTEGSVLKNFTHVILDEIHERDIDSDFIMVALKHVLSKHSNFKLILMSATINAELFAQYFSQTEIQKVSNSFYDFVKNQKSSLYAWGNSNLSQNQRQIEEEKDQFAIQDTWGMSVTKKEEKVEEAPFEKKERKNSTQQAKIIRISEQGSGAKNKYELYINYLEHIQADFGIRSHLTEGDFSTSKALFHDECIKICLKLIAYLVSPENTIETELRNAIKQQSLSNSGSPKLTLPDMLIFLPGLNEIYHLMDAIKEDVFLKGYDLDPIPLHSTLDTNQKTLFKTPDHQNQRKIILSTNIAESSITIPNVLYVIDFCLMKEITTSGRNNVEILDLVWASKASLRQRAGRTGRVSDGFVFRLIREEFYKKHLEPFSKPELHRSPLDKLILRIKTLHESEKAANKSEYLFENPKTVLGRAIEPPYLERISLAAKNLRDNGALGMSTQQGEDNFGEITFLGKVFCDLPCEMKVSKMILLGVAFGLPEESISLAAILSQKKSFFKPDTKAVPRNRFKFMNYVFNMADGTNSDHIALLRVYASWEKKFVPKNPPAQQFKKHMRYEDRDYCRDRFLDPVILRDVYNTKKDILSRLQRLDIFKRKESWIEEEADHQYFWENSQIDQSQLKEKYALLKFIIAGGFYCTYILPSEGRKAFDMSQANSIQSDIGMDPLKTIIMKHPYRAVENWSSNERAETEKVWFRMLKSFKPDKIKFFQDKAYISFKDEDYEFAIKTLSYIKKSPYESSRQISVYNKKSGSTIREELIFNHASKDNMRDNFYSNWIDPMDLPLFSSLGEVEYYNSHNLVDFITKKKIVLEADSINNIVLMKKLDHPIFLVGQEYFEKKSGIFSTRYSTLLDDDFFDCKYLLPLVTMIFAPEISLEQDKNKTRYRKMMIGENELDLEFYLTPKDIEEINEIRRLLQDFFMNKDRSSFKNTYSSIWKSIKDLLKRDRVSYIPQEKWEETFRKEYEDKLPKTTTETQPRRQRRQINTKSSEIAPSKFFYLNPIHAEELLNARFANNSISQETILETQKYYCLYREWKKSKLEQIKRTGRLIDNRTTFLACGTCGTKLCDFTCIGEQILNGFYRHLISSRFIFKTLPYSIEDQTSMNWHLDKIKYHKFLYQGEYVSHELLGCYQNHELALNVHHRDFSKLSVDERLNLYQGKLELKGEDDKETNPFSIFPVVENIYITRFSNLILIFPDDSQEPFDFDNFEREGLIRKNQKKLEERERRLKYMNCPICQIPSFATKEDFKAHLKEKCHIEEEERFVENLATLENL